MQLSQLSSAKRLHTHAQVAGATMNRNTACVLKTFGVQRQSAVTGKASTIDGPIIVGKDIAGKIDKSSYALCKFWHHWPHMRVLVTDMCSSNRYLMQKQVRMQKNE